MSKLTLSAFRCSILTNKEAETNRLFEVGYKSGQSFLDIFDKLNDEQRKLASPNLAILWRSVAGSTKDLVLGRHIKTSWAMSVIFMIVTNRNGREISKRRSVVKTAWSFVDA